MEARGDELVAAPVRGATEWFASVDGTPIGPLSTEDIVSRITTGVLEWDAHVWREGYAEWVTIDASDTLVRAVASSRGAVADEPRTDSTERTTTPSHDGEDDGYDRDERTINEDAPTIAALEDSPTRVAYDETPTRMYSSHSAPPGVLPPVARSAFASRPPGSLPPIAQPAYGESAPNMFAASQGNGHYSSPAIEVSRAQLTGGPLPLPSAGRAAQSAPPARAGFAGGEGSGLIDIRALASLAQTRMSSNQRGILPPSTPAAEAAAEEVVDNDPLASFGSGHGVAFAALDSLAPAGNREKPKDKTVPFAIVTGAAMIAAATFAALYITRAPALTPPATVTAAQPAEPLAPSVVSEAQPAAGAQPTPAPAAAEAEQAAAPEPPAAEEPAEPAEAQEPVAQAPKAARVGGKRVVRAKAAAGATPSKKAEAAEEDEEDADPLETAEAKPEKAPPPTVDDILLADDGKAPPDKDEAQPEAAKPAKAQPSNRSIDDLLDVAVAKKAAAPAAAPAPAADGAAESPSRADVLAAMRKIEPEVRACAAGEATPVTGTANVAITVAGSTGKVTSAEVSGLTGPIGSCIARVARTAMFAPFTKDRFSVTFPYRFK